MAGCGSKKMAKGGMVKKAKGGMMISPRKAMAMGKKPSGSKTKVKKFAAGGMVGGIRAPTTGPLPGANPRIPGPLPGANPRVVGGPKVVVDVLPGMPGGPLNRNNSRFGQGTGSPAPLRDQYISSSTQPDSRRPVGVRGPIMFSKGGAVKKGK